jgi:hypothetical protein
MGVRGWRGSGNNETDLFWGRGMRMHEWLASGWGYVMVGDICEPF